MKSHWRMAGGYMIKVVREEDGPCSSVQDKLKQGETGDWQRSNCKKAWGDKGLKEDGDRDTRRGETDGKEIRTGPLVLFQTLLILRFKYSLLSITYMSHEAIIFIRKEMGWGEGSSVPNGKSRNIFSYIKPAFCCSAHWCNSNIKHNL